MATMIYIPNSNGRFGGNVPLQVNGVLTRIPVDADYSASDGEIAALIAAGIPYQAPVVEAGKIFIPAARYGYRLALGINGTVAYLMTGTAFVPTPEILAVLDQKGISYSAGAGGAAPAPAPAPAPTPTPTPTPVAYVRDTTPNGTLEAVMSPVPSTERSTWSFTRHGFIQEAGVTVMPTTGENVSYYPTLVDARDLASFPADFALFTSTDHSTLDGGFFLSVCRGDPRVVANWKTYDAALAAGWFDSVAVKPAGNPIFGSAFGAKSQWETPEVNKVNGKYLMTFQASSTGTAKLSGGRKQSTGCAVSTDLLNWTQNGQAVLRASAMQFAAPGDGDYTYFVWGPNKHFTDVPYAYMGYSLIGGGKNGFLGQWGSNNPDPEVDYGGWVFLGALNAWTGRVGDSLPSGYREFVQNCIHVNSQMATPQGVSVLANNVGVGAGAANRNSELCEIILSKDGRDILRKPIRVLNRGTGTDLDAGQVNNVSAIIYGNSRVIAYAAGNSNGDLSIGIASSPLRNPANTFHDPLPFPIPADTTVEKYNFAAITTRPANFTKVGNVTETYSDGLNVSLTGAADEFYLFNNDGFRGDLTDFVEIYWTDFRAMANPAYFQPYIGFVDSKGLRSTWKDGLFISGNEATDSGVQVHRLVDGVKTSQYVAAAALFGYGTGTANLLDKKTIGLRWWRTRNRCILLGEGRVELWEVNALALGVDPTKTLYPVIGLKGTAGGAASMRIGTAGFSQKEDVVTVVNNPVTISGTPTDLRNAANAAVWNFDSTPVDIGTPSADRYVIVCAGATSNYTPASTGITVDLNVNGTMVPMTRVGMFQTKEVYGTGSDFMAAFVLKVPEDVTTVIPRISQVGAGSNLAGKAFCSVVAAKGIDPASATWAKAGGARGVNEAYYTEIAKASGGLVVAAEFNSTSGESYSNGAYEIPVANLPTAYVGSSGTGAGQAWTGILNRISPSAIVESGGLGGSAMVAVSFAPLNP